MIYSNSIKSLIVLDIKLIVRNLRPLLSLIFIGLITISFLILITTSEKLSEFYLFFSCLFATGLLSIVYNFTPAWESNYFSFLQVHNISYRDFYQSKYYLYCFISMIGLMFSLIVLWFMNFESYFIYAITAFFYNVGFFVYILFLMSKYNDKPITNLNGFGEGITFPQFISTGILILPPIIITTCNFFFSTKLILMFFLIIGAFGFAINNLVVKLIAGMLEKEKYHFLITFNNK